MEIPPRRDLAERATGFGVEIARFVERERKRSRLAQAVLDQLRDAGTSIGAHCAEAEDATTRRHLVVLRLGALREAKEALHWLTIIREAYQPESPQTVARLADEARELVAILTTCVRKLRGE